MLGYVLVLPGDAVANDVSKRLVKDYEPEASLRGVIAQPAGSFGVREGNLKPTPST